MTHKTIVLAVLLCAAMSGCGDEPPTSEQASVAAMTKGLDAARGGDSAVALEHLQKATMLDPKNHRAWHALGELHRQQKSWAMAADALDRAVALADDEPLYREHLGMVEYERGHVPTAKIHLSMAQMLHQRAGGDTTEITAFLERIKAEEEREEREAREAREREVAEARRRGVIEALEARQSGAFASLTGTGDVAAGLDDGEVFGDLLDDEADEPPDGLGFGRQADGSDGGTGWGTIGNGRYGTIGRGSGTGSGYGAGAGRGGARDRRAATPQVRSDSATVTGDLDKNIIRRYIRRKLPQITYCYEKQLMVEPGLAGRVIVEFQITGKGAVVDARASGVSREVSSCVAGVIEQIVFPKPKDGGNVTVRYPLTFRPE